ncbi:MAG: peptide chain release factor-like protein [Phycisphaeraceae bacterium]|nr:peptide chain release factor-like protein [Phycisphaeraceae bacterium]
MTHPAALDTEDLLRQCSLERGRSSGPGGQHRNRVQTKVVLTHTPTGLSAQASERRSAEQNRRVALRRLRLLLATDYRAPVARGDCRSELWRSRCDSNGRIVCNPRHADYPALLAEALDVLAATNYDLKRSALRLCCTPSQLVRLIAEHPPALQALNLARHAHGLGTIKAP